MCGILGPTFPQTSLKEGGIHPYSASLHFFQFSLRYLVPQYTNITCLVSNRPWWCYCKEHILSHLNTRYGPYIDQYLIFRHGTTTVSITCLYFSYLPLIASYKTPQISVEFQQQNCTCLLLESAILPWKYTSYYTLSILNFIQRKQWAYKILSLWE